VTERPFPDAAELAELSPARRRMLAEAWLGQAATEARVARSFAVIHQSLSRLGADPGLLRLSARAVDDEHRHAALCEELAGLHAGRPVGPHPRLSDRRPAHPTAESQLLRDTLYVVGQCALNETFASAYLSAARRGATTPLARHALRELLEDEVDHARIGWAFLSDAPAEAKHALDDWLLPLTVSNLREWRQLILPKDDSLAAHGVPPMEVARDAITSVLTGVVVPGFAHVGLDTRNLERWIARGALV
jgi:hypothetical protein